MHGVISLPERLIISRKDLGLSQKAAALKLGINVMTLNRYEKGTRTPDSYFLLRVAREFRCNPDWLLRPALDKVDLPESEKELYERLLAEKDKRLEAKDKEIEILKKCHAKEQEKGTAEQGSNGFNAGNSNNGHKPQPQEPEPVSAEAEKD